MDSFKLNCIIPLLRALSSGNLLQALLLDILTLQQRLENPRVQASSFQKSEREERRRLQHRKNKYEHLRRLINQQGRDYFFNQIHRQETLINRLKAKPEADPLDRLCLDVCEANLRYYHLLFIYKRRFGELQPLEDLMRDEENLFRMFA